MVAVPEGVAVLDGVCEGTPVCEAVVDCDGELPGASERVPVDESVPVIVGEAVRVGDSDGVDEGVQRSRSNRLGSSVSRVDASVLLLASSTSNVWLIARVLHVLAMPAAVQATGAVQHVGVWGARFIKDTLKSCWPVAEPDLNAQLPLARSVCQNSALDDPPLL